MSITEQHGQYTLAWSIFPPFSTLGNLVERRCLSSLASLTSHLFVAISNFLSFAPYIDAYYYFSWCKWYIAQIHKYLNVTRNQSPVTTWPWSLWGLQQMDLVQLDQPHLAMPWLSKVTKCIANLFLCLLCDSPAQGFLFFWSSLLIENLTLASCYSEIDTDL